MDIENAVRLWLVGQFPSTRFVVEFPAGVERIVNDESTPVVRVSLVGGPRKIAFDQARISIEALDTDRTAVLSTLNDVSDALALRCAGRTAGGCTFRGATTSIPQPFTYGDTKVRAATVQVTVRALPARQ